MTSSLTLFDRMRSQRAEHTNQIETHWLPPLMTLAEFAHYQKVSNPETHERKHGRNIDPIVDAYAVHLGDPPGVASGGTLIGYYQRLDDNSGEQPWNPVFSGQASKLYRPIRWWEGD